jgi:hypothetical protein
MFDESRTDLTPDLADRWTQIKAIYAEAAGCRRYHLDENAWTEVVRLVLRAAGVGALTDMLQLNKVSVPLPMSGSGVTQSTSNPLRRRQTQSIDPRFLPILPGTTDPFAKETDFALAFNPYHDRVRPILEDVRSKRPGTDLSQMSDVYTSSVVLGCGLEIKGPGGNHDEAVVQLGIWCAAGLLQRRELSTTDISPSQKPLLGWTVIGHDWRLHMSWRDDDTGDVVSQPQSSCVGVG